MTKETSTETYTIDATNRSLGRVATQAAHVLMGKHTPAFERHIAADIVVKVENASKLHLPKRKQQDKKYAKYSGYPGGLRFETLEEVIIKKGHEEVVRRAVRGMLPANKLRSVRLKHLIVTE